MTLSVKCYLLNVSDYTLTLHAPSLQLNGKWSVNGGTALAPPATIAPWEYGQWQSENDGLWQGTNGNAVYIVEGTNASINCYWTNPAAGANDCSATVNGTPGDGTATISHRDDAQASFTYTAKAQQPAPGAPVPSQGQPSADTLPLNAPPEKPTLGAPPEITPDECQYLLDWDSEPDTLPKYDEAAKNLARLRASDLSVLDPVNTKIKFREDEPPEDAHQYQVKVRGRTITVYEPANGAPAKQWLPGVKDMVAPALSCLPTSALDGLEKVILTPYPLIGFPTAVAWTLASLKTIYYCCRDRAHLQGDIDWAIVHEGGHIVSHALRTGDIEFHAGPAWKKAMDDDRAIGTSGVSQYGDSDGKGQEDYAESALMYALTVDTKCERTARKRFPNRYAILEKQYAGQFAQTK